MNLPVDTESIVFADEKNVITPDIDVDSIRFDDATPDLSGGPNAQISAAPPRMSAWQRIKDSLQSPDLMKAAIQGPMSLVTDAAVQAAPQIMEEITRPSPEESIARAQNIYAISQNSGVPQQDIAEHYEDLMKMSSVTGIESDPTKYEVLEKAMTLGLAPAMFAAPVPTAVGLLGFAALDAIFPTDAFIPEDASAESRDNIRLIGMLVKGGVVGGFMHSFPKAPKDFPSGAQLVERPLESAGRMRDNAVAIFKAFTKQKMVEKGLPTEVVITPEQLTQIHLMSAEFKREMRIDARRQRLTNELKDRILEGEKIDKGYDPQILRDAKQDALDHIAGIQAKEGKVRNRFQQIRFDLTKQLADADRVTTTLGLDPVKVETAINNGMSVKVPVENLVDVAAKSPENFVKVQEILSQKGAKNVETEIIDKSFFEPLKDSKGFVDSGAAADLIAAKVKAALADGDQVVLTSFGKKVPIVNVERGMMQDAKGQRWGTMDIQAGGSKVEITKSGSGGSLPTETTASIEPIKLEPVQGTGESKTMGLSESVRSKAVESGIADIFQDLPTSEKLKIPEQARLALDYLKKDPKMVQRVAMGEIPSPDPKVTPEAFFVALVDKATREGDAFSLHALATSSKLVQESRIMGQRIRTLGELDPNSPVKAIKDVSKAREEAAQKTTGKKSVAEAKEKVVNDIKKSIKEHTPTIDEWASFLKELEC